jgi:hypothetical protein
MIWQFIQSFIRHSLTGGGAVLVAHGLSSQSDTTTAIGALMTLIGFAHSVYVKWKASQPAKPAGIKIPILFLFLPLLISMAFGLTACQSTPQQATYQAAGTTIVSVDAAMTEWGAYVSTAQPGTNAETAVESGYEKYQAAMAVVCDAGAAYAATGGTNAQATAALDQAIANSSQELTDLETLISSFGVKLQ